MVTAAGCEALPACAKDELLLVPLTHQMAAEADDWALQPYHVVLCDAQRESLRAALQQIPRDEVRLALKAQARPAGAQHRS